MATNTISPLRQRMIEDISARKLSTATQKGHIRSCRRFAAFLRRSPDTATAEDIRRFQVHLSDSDMSIGNRNRTMTGLRFLFRVTLRRPDLASEIYHIREPRKIPLVISPDEAKRLLAVFLAIMYLTEHTPDGRVDNRPERLSWPSLQKFPTSSSILVIGFLVSHAPNVGPE